MSGERPKKERDRQNSEMDDPIFRMLFAMTQNLQVRDPKTASNDPETDEEPESDVNERGYKKRPDPKKKNRYEEPPLETTEPTPRPRKQRARKSSKEEVAEKKEEEIDPSYVLGTQIATAAVIGAGLAGLFALYSKNQSSKEK